METKDDMRIAYEGYRDTVCVCGGVRVCEGGLQVCGGVGVSVYVWVFVCEWWV